MLRLVVDPELPADELDDDPSIERAAALLRAGGLVAFATETVYGLGGLAHDEEAARGIFAAKGRPPDDPLIVHVDPSWDLSDVAASWSPLARRLTEAFWPGPLTVITPKAEALPSLITSDLPDVAVRAPAHPVAAALLRKVGRPVAAPSANRFSYVSATTADHVEADLGDAIDAVLDAGPSTAGIESTVVRVEDDHVVVLRHGALPADAIAERLGVDVVDAPAAAPSEGSPGRLLTHYAPGTHTVARLAGSSAVPAGSSLILGFDESVRPDGASFSSLGSLDDLDDVARHLYERLRDADGSGHDTIVVEFTGRAGLGRALDDRLRKAASGRVIDA